MLDASDATQAPRPGRKSRLRARFSAIPNAQIRITARGNPRPAKWLERIETSP